MQTLLTRTPRIMADTIDGFLFYLQHVRGLSVNTVLHYGHDLSLFLRYLALDLDTSILEIRLDDITTKHIEGFLAFLTDARGNSQRSTKRRLAALRSFFAYVHEPVSVAEGSVTYNPAAGIATPHVSEPPPRALTGEDARRILRAARAHGPNPIRDYAILRLFLHCGARLSEVLHLKLQDIYLCEGYIRLGSGGIRDRLVPLSDETAHALNQYLMARPTVAVREVFISRNGKPITKGAIYHLVGKCLSNASLEGKVNIHMLRHTCFTLLAKEGFGVEELQTLAGLRRTQMPKAYLRLAATAQENEAADGM